MASKKVAPGIRFREDRTLPYQARVTVDGASKTRSFRTKSEARAWLAKARSAMLEGDTVAGASGSKKFRVFASDWMAANRLDHATATWKRDESYMRSLILPTFGNVAVRSITPPAIEDWLAGLDKKESTKAKTLQLLRSVLERARKDGAIVKNPADDISRRPSPAKTKRKGKALNDSEISRLIAAAYQVDEDLRRGPSHHPTAFAIVAMARLGLRASEALGLNWQDFDLKARRVTIARTIERDGTERRLKAKAEGDTRTVALPDDVVQAYKRHRRDVSPMHARYLFTNSVGKRASYPMWRRRRFARAAELAGLEIVSHDLRRTFITRAYFVDGWTPPQVMAAVGHTNAKLALEIYTDVTTQEPPVPSALNAF